MSKEMTTQAREARNAYYRRWRAEHRETVRETNRRYWENRIRKEAERMSREHEDETNE